MAFCKRDQGNNPGKTQDRPMFSTILDKFATHIAAGLAALVIFVSLLWYFTYQELESSKEELTSIKAQRDNERQRYQRYMTSYDDAIKSIVKYYDTEIIQVKDFKRRDNETDCEAANRLLDSFKY